MLARALASDLPPERAAAATMEILSADPCDAEASAPTRWRGLHLEELKRAPRLHRYLISEPRLSVRGYYLPHQILFAIGTTDRVTYGEKTVLLQDFFEVARPEMERLYAARAAEVAAPDLLFELFQLALTLPSPESDSRWAPRAARARELLEVAEEQEANWGPAWREACLPAFWAKVLQVVGNDGFIPHDLAAELVARILKQRDYWAAAPPQDWVSAGADGLLPWLNRMGEEKAPVTVATVNALREVLAWVVDAGRAMEPILAPALPFGVAWLLEGRARGWTDVEHAEVAGLFRSRADVLWAPYVRGVVSRVEELGFQEKPIPADHVREILAKYLDDLRAFRGLAAAYSVGIGEGGDSLAALLSRVDQAVVRLEQNRL